MEEAILKDKFLNELVSKGSVSLDQLTHLFENKEDKIIAIVSEFERKGLAKAIRIEQGIGILTVRRLDYAVQFYNEGGFTKIQESKINTQNRNEELLLLQKKNLELQNENLMYAQTIRDKENVIRELEAKNKFFELLKNYWWLFTILFSIGIFIGKVLN